MAEKKPVYNGYEERYLNGSELKNLFAGHYYATGRHHSVILGITIPDYLDLSVDLETINLQKTCPACGAPMKFKEGKYGEFLGCSQYPNCKQTAKIPIIGNSKNP